MAMTNTTEENKHKKVFHADLYVRLDNEYHEVHCNIIRRTEKAILIDTVDLQSMPVQKWIPVSQIKVIHEGICKTGYNSHIVVANWILRKGGML